MSSVPKARATTKLVLVGGGKRPSEALAHFVAYSGGKSARILVVAWGDSDSKGYFDATYTQLMAHGPEAVVMAPELLALGSKEDFLRLLASVGGVWFTGGDQLTVMRAIKKLDIAKDLHEAYERGVAFGGSSAGTAIMSQVMFTGKGSLGVIDPEQTEMAEGLGLLTRVILDQHFIARMRLNRLLGQLLKYRDVIGLGIDEGTALVIENNTVAQVVGDSFVTVIQPNGRRDAFSMELMKAGDYFEIRSDGIVRGGALASQK